MTKEESREERKKVAKKEKMRSKSSLNKVYYWIIGILFFILFLLVMYIFANSGDNVDLGQDEEANSVVQEIEISDKDDAATDSIEEPEEGSEVTDETGDVEQDEQDTEESVESETTVNENAPLDTEHAVDYNSGSADRLAIKDKVMQATGLGEDLIENWVGNNGPGRVVADVYKPDKSEVYRVYLQYGDGDWHVTSYESLSSVPEN